MQRGWPMKYQVDWRNLRLASDYLRRLPSEILMLVQGTTLEAVRRVLTITNTNLKRKEH